MTLLSCLEQTHLPNAQNTAAAGFQQDGGSESTLLFYAQTFQSGNA